MPLRLSVRRWVLHDRHSVARRRRQDALHELAQGRLQGRLRLRRHHVQGERTVGVL